MDERREIWRMRRDLEPESLQPVLPAGISLRTFADSDARRLHDLLAHGYRRGGGNLQPFEVWLPQLTGDSEFERELCFLAHVNGELAGAAICWATAFVKDLVVHESCRRRGLGEALLLHCFQAFRHRGSQHVDLKVQSDNRCAIRLYERVGMRVVERLAAG